MPLAAKIRARIWSGGRAHPSHLDPADVRDALADPTTLCWVDLLAPTKEELDALAAELDLDPSNIEDALAPHERPKLTEINGRIFFVVYATRLEREGRATEEGKLQVSRISGFLLDHGLVTIRLDDDVLMGDIMRAADTELNDDERDAAGLVHVLLDHVVDGHFDTIQELDAVLEDLEDELFDTDTPPRREFSAKAYSVRKDLSRLRRYILPMREVVVALVRHRFAGRTDPRFFDLQDHILRAGEWTDGLRDVVTNLVETHLQMQDARLNVVMKKLAAWAAIIAVPTLVTGWFGQNIPFPGADHVSGLIVSTLLVAGLSLTVYMIMRNKDWL